MSFIRRYSQLTFFTATFLPWPRYTLIHLRFVYTIIIMQFAKNCQMNSDVLIFYTCTSHWVILMHKYIRFYVLTSFYLLWEFAFAIKNILDYISMQPAFDMETSIHYLTHMNISLLFIYRNALQKFAHEHKTMKLLERNAK